MYIKNGLICKMENIIIDPSKSKDRGLIYITAQLMISMLVIQFYLMDFLIWNVKITKQWKIKLIIISLIWIHGIINIMIVWKEKKN
mgnify:CR=1 FL=1